MKNSQAADLLSRAAKDLIDVCPHCDTKAHLTLLFQESHVMRNRDVVYYATFRCVPCKSLIIKTHKFTQNPYVQEENLTSLGWMEKFPGGEVVHANKFEGSVPPDALNDFKEGMISLYHKCPKAAVSMFRRALQSALLDRGADAKKDLIDQIKTATFLTQDIKDWAHNIRIFGNWGAHPQDDNLKEVDEKVAKETQSFLEEFFNYVYVMPSRVANARQQNSPPKNSSPKS